MELFLGIDTSCYTTSLAIVDGKGNLLSEARRLLAVPKGGRGLAQNEAVFQHIANMAELFKEVIADYNIDCLQGVCASIRPRPVDGSYMPVFTVAESYGKSAAILNNIPFVGTSHQEGHIAAGVWSAQGPRESTFLAVHLSGGTTEVLKVTKCLSGQQLFNIELLGGSSDLHAGQFIDRVGVALGLPFPAGPHMEKLAVNSSLDVTLPSSVKGYDISFSGPEAAAMRMIEKNVESSDIARAVERCVGNSLEKVIGRAMDETGISSVLVVGGVSANLYIRERLFKRLQRNYGSTRMYFADPSLSTDNAVGVALLGLSILTKESTCFS